MTILKPTPKYDVVQFIKGWREKKPEWNVGDCAYILDTSPANFRSPRWPNVQWHWEKVQLTEKLHIEGYGYPLWNHTPSRQTVDHGGSWEPGLFKIEDVEVS